MPEALGEIAVLDLVSGMAGPVDAALLRRASDVCAAAPKAVDRRPASIAACRFDDNCEVVLDTVSKPQPIRTEALGFKIAAELRNDILLGRLAAGTVLNQERLCERFETSRMPVRDALHLLHHERLLVHDRGKHLCVAGFQPDEIADIYAVKAVVHGRATRRATEKSTANELQRLKQANERMRAGALAARHSEVADANWEFHKLINSFARAPYLIAALRTLNVRIGADLFSGDPKWTTTCIHEHSQIIDAMVAGDGISAEGLMIDHVHHSAELIGAWLRTRQDAAHAGQQREVRDSSANVTHSF
jgi:DNA-binding GntR family transcriptional regulator